MDTNKRYDSILKTLTEKMFEMRGKIVIDNTTRYKYNLY